MDNVQNNKETTEQRRERLKRIGFQPGHSGNPGGRPKNPLKEYSLKEFESWTDKEKKEFLKKISPIDRWKMTEGNPKQDTEIDATIIGPTIIRLDE